MNIHHGGKFTTNREEPRKPVTRQVQPTLTVLGQPGAGGDRERLVPEHHALE